MGEAASVDYAAAADYPAKLKALILEGGYMPQQVFNVDETGLFWKRMPNRTFISKAGRQAPGFKAAKDRITLMLCSNAAGDFKLKPLAVYHSRNPRAFKGLSVETLPVHWRSNKKGWVTSSIADNWLISCFTNEYERYCRRENISFKALILMDNAPSH